MSDVLIDTHVLAWSLVVPSRLTSEVRCTLAGGATVHVPPCAFHEIAPKVRKGKWSEMALHVGNLDTLCFGQGFRIAPYTGRMVILSGLMEWDHADPFDRMVAATAIQMACPLISKDSAFDGLAGFPGWKGRFWSEDV